MTPKNEKASVKPGMQRVSSILQNNVSSEPDYRERVYRSIEHGTQGAEHIPLDETPVHKAGQQATLQEQEGKISMVLEED